jgi:hypothetical protein
LLTRERRLQEHLRTLLTTKDVNKYLYSFQPNCRSFLTSFQPGISAVYSQSQSTRTSPPRRQHHQLDLSDRHHRPAFKDKIGDSIKDDMKMLESLQYDKR